MGRTNKNAEHISNTRIEAYSHASDQNIQVTPYQGPIRKEYRIADFLDPTPQTTQQKRKEQISLKELQ